MELLASEAPSQSGRPISQWSGREIAEEMVRRGIVERISRRHAARLLKKGGFQPHLFRYWLTEVPDPQRAQKINEGCVLYMTAAQAAQQGERTISLDAHDRSTSMRAPVEKWTLKSPDRDASPR